MRLENKAGKIANLWHVQACSAANLLNWSTSGWLPVETS